MTIKLKSQGALIGGFLRLFASSLSSEKQHFSHSNLWFGRWLWRTTPGTADCRWYVNCLTLMSNRRNDHHSWSWRTTYHQIIEIRWGLGVTNICQNLSVCHVLGCSLASLIRHTKEVALTSECYLSINPITTHTH